MTEEEWSFPVDEDEDQHGRAPRPPARGARLRGIRRIAIGGALLAVIALGLTAWRILSPAGSGCQSAAWGAVPAAADLPQGWSTAASQFDPDRLSMTLVGPTPPDQTSSRAVVYVTVTCYADGAADAVTRAQAAAGATGATVARRTDLGDQAYSSVSASGSTFIQFRHGHVVALVAASGAASAAEVEAVAVAFDRALGGNGTAAANTLPPVGATATPQPSELTVASPAPSVPAGPSASPAAPELEAALPTTVAGSTLTINSALGGTILGTDAGSRAISAALTTAGLTVDAFQIAQAFDASGATDLSITNIRVSGMDPQAVRKLILETWLSAGGSGVTLKSTTLGGQDATLVDYGDGGMTPYVIVRGDITFVIETKDAGLAAQAAAAIAAK